MTADALHCQRDHVAYLAQRGARWILTVKGNQPNHLWTCLKVTLTARSNAATGSRGTRPWWGCGARITGRPPPAGNAGPRGRRGSGVRGGPQGRRAAMRSALEVGGAAPHPPRRIPTTAGGDSPFGAAVRRPPRPGRLPDHQLAPNGLSFLRRPTGLPALRASRRTSCVAASAVTEGVRSATTSRMKDLPEQWSTG